LIVTFDATNDGNDTQQLYPIAEKAKQAPGEEERGHGLFERQTGLTLREGEDRRRGSPAGEDQHGRRGVFQPKLFHL
jgi:hypothetical protein